MNNNSSKPICSHYVNGTCGRGAKCRFYHPEQTVAPPKAPSPAPSPPAVVAKKEKPRSNKKPKTPVVPSPAPSPPAVVAKKEKPRSNKKPKTSTVTSAALDDYDEEEPPPLPKGSSSGAATPPAVTRPVPAAKSTQVESTPSSTPKRQREGDSDAKAVPAEKARKTAQSTDKKDGKRTPKQDHRHRDANRNTPSSTKSPRNSGKGDTLPAPGPAEFGLSTLLDELVRLTASHPKFEDQYGHIFDKGEEDGWRSTDSSEGSLGGSMGLPLVGMDCEMIKTTDADNALAKVGLVALGYPRPAVGAAPHMELLNKVVHPPDRTVLDLRSSITGLTMEELEGDDVIKTFEEAQDAVLELLHGQCVLVGHSLNNDLAAMKLVHRRVIDTALLFRSPLKHQMIGLKDIVLHMFGTDCQPENQPHNHILDAAWPLELVRKVVDECNKAGCAKLAPEDRLALVNAKVQMPIPTHFTSRLNMHQIPEGANMGDILFALRVGSAACSKRDLQFRSKDGKTPMGATIFKFEKQEDAKRIFHNLSNDGMKQDRDGLWQKKVRLDRKKFPEARHFWVKGYCDPGKGAPQGEKRPASAGSRRGSTDGGRKARAPKSEIELENDKLRRQVAELQAKKENEELRKQIAALQG